MIASIRLFPFVVLFLLLALAAQASEAIPRRDFLLSTCAGALVRTTPSSTIAWEIVSPSASIPGERGVVALTRAMSVGALTVELLRDRQIPFVGDETRFYSIFGTATGRGVIETVNADTFRVFGWCYEVDGQRPDAGPNDFVLTPKNATLRWYYAVSVNEHGAWRSVCQPLGRR